MLFFAHRIPFFIPLTGFLKEAMPAAMPDFMPLWNF